MVDQKLITAAIWIAALIIVPLAITHALEGDPPPLLIISGLCFISFVFFVLKDGSCALPLIGGFVIGKLNFLPFGLSALIVFTLGLIFYYFFAYFTLKQKGLSTGPSYLFLPILVITTIVLYHNRHVGLHAFGSSSEGSRPGLLMLLAALGYFCGVSLSHPSARFLSYLPLICTFLSLVTSLPNLLSTFFPSLSPYLYYLTDNINLDVYFEANGIDTDTRYGALATIGMVLEVFLVSYYPIHTWLRPQRWWVPIMLLLSLGLIVLGGYRSNVAMFVVVLTLATWCYYSWRALIIFPIILLSAFLLSLCVQNKIVDLSATAQRSLSFLPGTWDPVAVDSANSSNDFRKNIWNVYMREELHKSPWIGNGFAFDSEEYIRLMNLSKTSETSDHYYVSKGFITAKMFHNGWLSLYDTVGLIGSVAFFFLIICMIGMTGHFVLQQSNHYSLLFPLKVWFFCSIVRDVLAYFLIFGDFGSTFPSLCAYAIILIQLQRMERSESQKTAVPILQQRENTRKPGSIVPQPSFLRPG